MVAYARKVLDTTAAYHNNGVFLKVMAYSWDIGSYFITVGKTNTGDFTQCGVRLFGS